MSNKTKKRGIRDGRTTIISRRRILKEIQIKMRLEDTKELRAIMSTGRTKI